MLVYCALLALSLIGAFVTYGCRYNTRQRKNVLNVLIALCVIVSAIRFNVGTDYYHFIDVYNEVARGGLSGSYTEFGYNLTCFILAKIGFGAQSLYVVTSAVLGLTVRYFIVRVVPERYWCFAVFLFIAFGFYFSSLNAIRQYFATAFCLIALVQYAEKRKLRFWVFIVCGTLVHTAALFVAAVPLVAYLIRKRNGMSVLFAFYAISLVFLVVDVRGILAFAMSFIDRWAHYANSGFFNNKNQSAVTKLFVPNMLFLWFFISQRGKSLPAIAKSLGTTEKTVNMVLAGALIYVATQNMFSGVLVLTRISELLFMCYIAFLVMVLELSKDRESRAIFASLYATYGWLLTVVTIFLMNGNGVMPYQTVFG